MMSEKDREKELLLFPLLPYGLVTSADFDIYRKQVCEDILKQVKDAQRIIRVEALKLQMKQNRLQQNLPYISNPHLHPHPTPNASYSDSDMSSTSSLEEQPPLRLSASMFKT
ncbi:hypothetical protein EON64_15100, partial [archaeon]